VSVQILNSKSFFLTIFYLNKIKDKKKLNSPTFLLLAYLNLFGFNKNKVKLAYLNLFGFNKSKLKL
jgi:hypothetical protein